MNRKGIAFSQTIMTNEGISTMDKPQNTIIKAILAFLDTIYTYLKNLLSSGFGNLFKRDPDLELNKPADSKPNGFRQKRFIYFALFLILMLSFFNSIKEVQRDEISYSQFLKLVQEAKIEKAVVTERVITGVIKSDDPKESGKHFVTVPLWQNDLAQMLTPRLFPSASSSSMKMIQGALATAC